MIGWSSIKLNKKMDHHKKIAPSYRREILQKYAVNSMANLPLNLLK